MLLYKCPEKNTVESYVPESMDVENTTMNNSSNEKLPQTAELNKQLTKNKNPLILSIDEIVERAIQNNNKLLEEVAIPHPSKLLELSYSKSEPTNSHQKPVFTKQLTTKLKPVKSKSTNIKLISTNKKSLSTNLTNLKPISTNFKLISDNVTNLGHIPTNMKTISVNLSDLKPIPANMKIISGNLTNLGQMSTNLNSISTSSINVKPISTLLSTQPTTELTNNTVDITPKEPFDIKEFKQKQKELVTAIIKKKNAKIKSVSQENRILRMKLEKLADTIEILEKEREKLKEFSLPKDMGKHVQGLYKELLKPKERFISPKVKRFAVELSEISMEAYEYVRDSLGSNLPHNRTLQKWRVQRKITKKVVEDESSDSADYAEDDMSEDDATNYESINNVDVNDN